MHDCIRHTRRGVAGSVGVFVLLALMSVCSESTETAEDVSWSAAALTSEASDLPEGRDIVRGAIDFMQSHDQLAFEAIATYEVVQESGQKLQFDTVFFEEVEDEGGQTFYEVVGSPDGSDEEAET